MQGNPTSANSVLGTVSGTWLNFAYDSIHQQLVVGRPGDNIVSLYKASGCPYQTYAPVIKK
jgi:hypothetical protein